ncbi:hypothetical protein [uncultured Maricaulis sp.]|uniref:hypothetical protein n=1 Tax=uncultured Maricaulis sp. TaxID=174710 RepID=UPI0030D75BAC
MPDRTLMTLNAVTRPDMLRRTACGDGVNASAGSIMSTAMTITMTTSTMRGQVGVD